jgi:hypothetical protein
MVVNIFIGTSESSLPIGASMILMDVIVRLSYVISGKEVRRMIGIGSLSLWRKTSILQLALILSAFPVRIGFTRTWMVPFSGPEDLITQGEAVVGSDRELAPETKIVKLKSEIRNLINELEKDFPESN